MLNQENLESIKKEINNFFQKIEPEIKIENFSLKEKTVCVNLKTTDPQLFIGENGQTLADIQHLLKAILKRKIKEDFYLDLDINGYKEKKIKYLKEYARRLADEVTLTREEKKLPPMPTYERRIIHLELATRRDVRTESVGKEPKRYVVIKPYP